ncbi:MAG: 3-hydroxyacyl-CoA dehydrogenase family protein [Bacteroidia bacterium]
MNTSDIKKVAIIGAGTMGLGIAQVFAQKGFETLLFDLHNNALEKAKVSINKNLDGAIKRGKFTENEKEQTISRLVFTTDFSLLKADFILEAILERVDLKVDLFKRLHDQNESTTIFATNTSTIPITQIGAQIPNPERLVGMHFFNPAHIMKLVEVISGVATNQQVAQLTYDLAAQLGKSPVMAKDAPGFIVNRVARHFYVESLKVLEENVVDHEGIDKLLESSGFKMGPFKLMDLIGVDTNFSVTSSMFNSFHQDSKFRPSRIQEQKVFAGHNGRKTGQGFYNYQD